MNFHELPDKDLDNIFKKAAESTDYPVKEGGWESVKAQLDNWDRFTSLFWRMLEMGSLILITGTILLIWLSGGNSIQETSGLRSAALYGEITNHQDFSVLAKESNTTEGMESFSDDSRPNRVSRSVISSDNDSDSRNSIMKSDQKIRIEKTAQAISGDNETMLVNSGNNQINKQVLVKKDIADLQSSPPGSFMPISDNSGKSLDKEIIINESTHRFGYSIGLSIGPDFSFVKNEKIGAGTYLGLIVDLSVLKRLNIVTGIYHTRKRYPVEGDYSLLYTGLNTINQNPQKIDVACHIIDIPVNVNYDLLQKPSFRIYSGVGISSYLMLTEEYSYNSGYGSYQSEELIIKNENQHFFGILNISAGYTSYFNTNWALQVEPFYKLPLQDIATANVRLNSFGMYLSLKYRIK